MQKISSYLYPNRITVVADVTLFPVRWNIVYQNRVKIYQGVDNVLTIDVKNSDQKRIDISAMTFKMCITDMNGKEFVTVSVIPSAILGLATATIPANGLGVLTPQFLSFSIYRINADLTKTVMYADTQFGAIGNMELVGSVLGVTEPPREINIFGQLTNKIDPFDVSYVSEAVNIRPSNFLQAREADVLTLEFLLLGFDGTIKVEFTDARITSSNIVWTTIETFAVSQSTSSVTKTYTYPTFNRELTWARVEYQNAVGNKGAVKKVLVTV
jgi:hypothetical protein